MELRRVHDPKRPAPSLPTAIPLKNFPATGRTHLSRLGVASGSAGRRLAVLEDCFETRLIVRGGQRFDWAAEGLAVLAAAEAVQVAVSEVSRALRSAKTDTAATEVAAHVVASGMGIGVVPCAVVLGRPELVRVFPEPVAYNRGFIVYHESVREMACVRSAVEALAEMFEEQRSLFSGLADAV